MGKDSKAKVEEKEERCIVSVIKMMNCWK